MQGITKKQLKKLIRYKKKDDPIDNIEYKIYSIARIKEKANEGSFDKLFKQDYEAAFNKLSFKKRVGKLVVI